MWENDLSVSIKCITNKRKETKMTTMYIPPTQKSNLCANSFLHALQKVKNNA
jgi:hypothetical protein